MNKIDRKIVLTPEECSFVQIYYDCKTIKSLFYAIKENYIAGIALIIYVIILLGSVGLLKKDRH